MLTVKITLKRPSTEQHVRSHLTGIQNVIDDEFDMYIHGNFTVILQIQIKILY